ncbi:MAG TPA: CoA ester lyase [Acidimicrobiia bacterium]|nr:CoA ester lyase [Acidimicrobiia bacterium]
MPPTMSLVDPIFVPADRPDRVDKAMKLGVDAVIIDLEDAVAPANKPLARKAAAELLRETTPECAVYVRVNGPGEPDLLAADIEGLAPGWPAVDGVVLPKAESADHVRHLAGLVPGKRLVPIVETALGIEHAASIAAATPPGGTLLFGPADLSAELGIVPTADGLELLMARSRVVMACAAAGLARPIDGPWLNLDDETGLEVSARHARRLGFAGKTAIHPRQLPAIRAAFAADADEVAWARRVVAAFEEAEGAGVGAVRLADGTFVDAPVADRARSILRASGATGGVAGG